MRTQEDGENLFSSSSDAELAPTPAPPSVRVWSTGEGEKGERNSKLDVGGFLSKAAAAAPAADEDAVAPDPLPPGVEAERRGRVCGGGECAMSSVGGAIELDRSVLSPPVRSDSTGGIPNAFAKLVSVRTRGDS